MRVAGLAPVENIPGLENIDVTSIVNGHMAYRAAMPRLLREVGWEVESDEFTEIEDPDPENHDKRQRELIKEIDEARKDAQAKPEKKRFGFFKRGKLAEKKGWETYDESMREAGHSPGTADDGFNNVLFDIEAIKAELASEQIEVKQLESTLPPMKLSLNGSPPPVGNTYSSPRSDLRDTKNYEGSTPYTPRADQDASQASLPNGHANDSFSQDHDVYENYDEHGSRLGSGENIRMSFDHPRLSPKMSFEHSRGSPSPLRSARSSIASPTPIPPPEESPKAASPLQRPEVQSPLSMPSGANGVSIDHNAWLDEDDEDFGKEKNVQMTFG
jgi:hypothetical protein